MNAPSTAMLAEHELGYGAFVPERFIGLAALYGTVAWFTFSGANWALASLCCAVQAYRAAYLAPGPNTENAVGTHIGLMFFAGIAIAIPHFIAPILGELVGLIAAYVLLFHLRGDRLLVTLLPTSTKPGKGLLPVTTAPVPVATLVQRRAELIGAVETLNRLAFFDATDDAVERAWLRRDVTALEALLTRGDTLNRQSRRVAGETYNACAALVDAARTRLAQGMKEAEPLMRQRGIDPGALKGEISARLAGDARIIAIETPRKKQPQYGRGLGQAWGKALTGNTSWQAALAVTVAAGVFALIHHSKRLRQLKEAEGQIVAMAAEMRGDAGRFRALIETRLLPQYDWALSVLDQLAALSASLGATIADNIPPALAADNAVREKDLRLRFAAAEGKMLVERRAGN